MQPALYEGLQGCLRPGACPTPSEVKVILHVINDGAITVEKTESHRRHPLQSHATTTRLITLTNIRVINRSPGRLSVFNSPVAHASRSQRNRVTTFDAALNQHFTKKLRPIVKKINYGHQSCCAKRFSITIFTQLRWFFWIFCKMTTSFLKHVKTLQMFRDWY